MSLSLRIEHLSIRAGLTLLVRDISLTLTAGTPLTLLGESGSGKSLVMHAIMGSLPDGLQAHGQIWLQLPGQPAQELLRLPTAQRQALWGRTLALLPQEPWLALDPTMTVCQQVQEVHQQVRGLSAAQARQQALDNLQDVALHDAVVSQPPVAERYPFQLSGGMCQRVAIAMADAAGGQVLLADEPTKGLDEVLRDSVAQQLLREAAGQRLLLTITHDLQLAQQLGGMIGVMRGGELLELTQAEQLLQQPRHDYSRRLLQADPGRWPVRQSSWTDAGGQLLEGRGLSKHMGGRCLFSGLHLRLQPGQITAITGPSGCGKTTLGNILLGLLPADQGQVIRVSGLTSLQLQKLYQDPPSAFAPHLTLAQGFADLQRRHGFSDKALAVLLERLGLHPSLLQRLPAAISGGELQRMALARALLLKPRLLLADEATSRLDPVSQQQVMMLLRDLCAEQGLALLLVSHDQALVARMADQVVSLEAHGVTA